MLYTSAEVHPPGDPTARRLGRIGDLLFRYARKDFNLKVGDRELRYTPHPRFVIVCDHPGTVRRLLLNRDPDAFRKAFVCKELDIEGDLLEGFRIKQTLAERAAGLSLADKTRLLLNLLRL